MARVLFAAIALNLIAVSHASAAPIYWTGNGNHYDFVLAPNINWVVARDAAAGTSFLGAPGHLVTVTSPAENAFITANLNNGLPTQLAWIGGFEPSDDGIWRWAVGPEAGVQFSLFATPTPPFNFANWGGIEPNDRFDGEDYAGLNIGQSFAGIAPGQWGDGVQSPSGDDHIVGYLVEFETSAIPEPSTLIIWSLLGVLGVTVGWWRRRRAA